MSICKVIGITRSATEILTKQNSEIINNELKNNTLIKMVDLTYNLFNEIQNNNHKAFGEILNANWLLKKSLTDGISNKFIDDCYDTAIKAGALGGKILGAGAGGFLMFYAPKKNHKKIESSLSRLQKVDVKFEKNGSQIIYYS